MFNVIEKFISVDGEGPTAGELATFIRFQGCNLRCSYCDTKYSWDEESLRNIEVLSAKEIYDYIKDTKVKNVTLTGGEPLIQKNISSLLELLNDDKDLVVHIETNGSVNIREFKEKYKNIIFILDYKSPSSNMMKQMDIENFNLIDKKDVYKFVIGSKEDINKALEIIKLYDLQNRCLVYFSPVFDSSLTMEEIVDFMKENNLNNVRLQVQLHKIIWDKEVRGV